MATSDDRLAGYAVVEGNFGTVRPALKIAFPYFGEKIRVHPFASDIGWTKFIETMRQHPAEDVDQGYVLDETMNYIRGQIHEDDWELFWETATKNHQNSMDLVILCQDIMAVIAGFPIGEPDGSNNGRPLTGHLSKGGSSRPGKQSRKDKRAAAAARVIQRAAEQGRADKALMALEQYEVTTGRRLSIVDGQVQATEISPGTESLTA